MSIPLSAGLRRRLLALQQSEFIHSGTRSRLLRLAGLTLGRDARVLSGVFFNSHQVEIGDASFLGQGGHVDGTAAWIRIGRNVSIGPCVRLVTSTHEVGDPGARAGTLVGLPIGIGDGCWIGASSTIIGGVQIAAGCIVAAGAVVTRSTEANGLYAGVPARRIKDLPAG